MDGKGKYRSRCGLCRTLARALRDRTITLVAFYFDEAPHLQSASVGRFLQKDQIGIPGDDGRGLFLVVRRGGPRRRGAGGGLG